jgi:hypothetical protein
MLACQAVRIEVKLNATAHCTPCSEVKYFEELANRKVFYATARTQWRIALNLCITFFSYASVEFQEQQQAL